MPAPIIYYKLVKKANTVLYSEVQALPAEVRDAINFDDSRLLETKICQILADSGTSDIEHIILQLWYQYKIIKTRKALRQKLDRMERKKLVKWQ